MEEFEPEEIDIEVFKVESLALSAYTEDIEKLGLYLLWCTAKHEGYLDDGAIWPAVYH